MNSETTLSERIALAVGDNVSAFSRASGVGESLLRQYIAGSKPGLDKAAAIAKAGNVNLMWLATGEGPMRGAAEQLSNEDFALVAGYNIQVSAGHGSLAGDELPTRRLAFRRKWLAFRGLNEKTLAMVFAKGDSMEPTISDNNTLMVDTSERKPQDGGIYVIRNGDQLLVKRIQVLIGKGVLLISDNKAYPEQLIDFNNAPDCEVVGKVVWIGKDV